jgi:glycosyltransferase involved in cell wall biosynthesis
MKKKILIHSIAFSPDGVSTAYLYNDIALNLVENNYDVIVLTTTPHYNIVEEELKKQPLKAKWGGLYYESYFNNIKVLHIPQRKFKSALLRMIAFVYWHAISMILGLLQGKIDLILSPSPPLTIGVISIFIGKLKNAKIIYNVQEIYPDFLINQGLLKFSPFINILKSIEKYVYNQSDAVTTIDSIFYETIVSRFKDKNKLQLIPNFVDTDVYKPINPKILTLDESLFPSTNNSLKLMYAGNIGHAQDWKPLLEIAQSVRNLPVEFWIIGEGVMREYLQESIKATHLSNVHVINYQPRETMASIMAYGDIHFIFMTPEMEGQGFPSKVYSIMACAKPLLIISGKNTPLNNFLSNTNSSFLVDTKVYSEKIQEILQIINSTFSNRILLQEMGTNGLNIILKDYSKEVVTQKYLQLINKLLS